MKGKKGEEHKKDEKMTAEEEFMKDVRRLFFLNLDSQAVKGVDNSFYAPFYQ